MYCNDFCLSAKAGLQKGRQNIFDSTSDQARDSCKYFIDKVQNNVKRSGLGTFSILLPAKQRIALSTSLRCWGGALTKRKIISNRFNKKKDYVKKIHYKRPLQKDLQKKIIFFYKLQNQCGFKISLCHLLLCVVHETRQCVFNWKKMKDNDLPQNRKLRKQLTPNKTMWV